MDGFGGGLINGQITSDMFSLLDRHNFSNESIEFVNKARSIILTNSNINSLDGVYDYLINRDEIFYVDPGTKKVNPSKETECFDRTKPARLTIYVEQPIRGSREITADIGHTFVGIEQDGISRYLGFYPDRPTASLIAPQDSEIQDNSGSPYNVSISKDVTPVELSIVIIPFF